MRSRHQGQPLRESPRPWNQAGILGWAPRPPRCQRLVLACTQHTVGRLPPADLGQGRLGTRTHKEGRSIKKIYSWEEKPALKNNEICAKANHKITFLIILCIRLSMLLCTVLSPLKLSYLLRATVNCVWVSKVILLSLFIH